MKNYNLSTVIRMNKDEIQFEIAKITKPESKIFWKKWRQDEKEIMNKITVFPSVIDEKGRNASYMDKLPNWIGDQNAIFEITKNLDENTSKKYIHYLSYLVDANFEHNSNTKIYKLLSATAEQKARAFVCAICIQEGTVSLQNSKEI